MCIYSCVVCVHCLCSVRRGIKSELIVRFVLLCMKGGLHDGRLSPFPLRSLQCVLFFLSVPIALCHPWSIQNKTLVECSRWNVRARVCACHCWFNQVTMASVYIYSAWNELLEQFIIEIVRLRPELKRSRCATAACSYYRQHFLTVAGRFAQQPFVLWLQNFARNTSSLSVVDIRHDAVLCVHRVIRGEKKQRK